MAELLGKEQSKCEKMKGKRINFDWLNTETPRLKYDYLSIFVEHFCSMFWDTVLSLHPKLNLILFDRNIIS